MKTILLLFFCFRLSCIFPIRWLYIYFSLALLSISLHLKGNAKFSNETAVHPFHSTKSTYVVMCMEVVLLHKRNRIYVCIWFEIQRLALAEETRREVESRKWVEDMEENGKSISCSDAISRKHEYLTISIFHWTLIFVSKVRRGIVYFCLHHLLGLTALVFFPPLDRSLYYHFLHETTQRENTLTTQNRSVHSIS